MSGGREVTATTEQLSRLEPGGTGEPGLERCIALRAVIGSRAYGLERPDSDFDRRGVYVAPAWLNWSLTGAPEQLEDTVTQDCYWEVGKCILLALKSNPAVLEALYSPIIEHADWAGQLLLEERGAFLSRLAAQTYGGYARAQFAKLQSDLRRDGRVQWKHAMHLIRLLRAGVDLLRTGELMLRVDAERRDLLAIRDGLLPIERVLEMHSTLQKALDDAVATSPLPVLPDYARANRLLLTIRSRTAHAEDLR